MTDTSEDEPKPGQWYPGMPSPNPKGRPRGIIDKRQRLQKIFSDKGEALVQVAVSAALEGDMQAMHMALARVAPTLKAQGERVEFDLDTELPLSGQANQILMAVSDGKLDVDTGRALIACINSVAGIKAVEELEQRIIVLEAKQV